MASLPPAKFARIVKRGGESGRTVIAMKPETQSFYELAVLRAVAQVRDNLDRALDLEELARTAALSPFHFHRVFRGMLGETPIELHRRLRLERAAHGLLHEATPITSIALAAGYETHESFTRTFRSHYDCSPTEFRHSRDLERRICVRPYQIELAARCGVHFQPQPAVITNIRFIEGESSMQAEIMNMPEMRVMTLRHVGPYNRISDAFARLGQIADAAQVLGPDTRMLAIFHDDPETTPAAELRSDAALTLSPGADVPDGLDEMRLPAGRYACTTHIGPYEQLGDAWARFMGEWLPRSGQRVREGVSFEIYRNTPADVSKDQLRTELYIPLTS